MSPRVAPGMKAVYGWLLLLPALVLLAAFTHYPAIATLWHSFFSTPKGRRPAVFVGLDNYQAMRDDPVFWQALWNNLWYAVGTVPAAIALALLMALWVNRNLAGRGFLRLAYFTPTVLPMVAVANIWLFFYTPAVRPDRAGPAGFRPAGRELAGSRAKPPCPPLCWCRYGRKRASS